MKFRFALVLLACTFLTQPALAEDGSLQKEPGRWAQDYVGRKADPAVRFGTLPNGLRYAIMHNETPKDGVSMRMRIGSGSLEERPDEQGLAHFLEHMAFRGSTNVPDGEVVHMLERQGLRFGPDTNAFTAQEQTVYMFNFPHADETALDTGFKLFREIGQRLTLAPAAVEAERGVILSEERLRDTPAYRAAKANFDNSLAGTRAVERWPIGLISTIKAATSERLRRFYEANYRPDNATIVVVGNIDPAKVEAEIRARFADWQPAAQADANNVGMPDPTHRATEFVADGAPDQLALTWVRPVDSRAETEAVDREYWLRQLGLTVLNNRLADQALGADSPFVGAHAVDVPELFGSAGLTQIGIAAAPEKWQAALDAVVGEQRRLVTDGVQPADLARAVTVLRTELQNRVANAPTRQDADIADGIVSAADDDLLYTSDAQDQAFAEPILAAATPAEVTTALKGAFAGKGPVLFRSAQKGAAGVPALEKALGDAYSQALTKQTTEAALTWPYTQFGESGEVVADVARPALGARLVIFGNGTRLLVKPTAYEKDKIRVSVSYGGGRAATVKALAPALWTGALFPVGGTAKLSAAQIQQWVQTKGLVVNANPDVGSTAFRLSGVTRPADLDSEMQLLTAYLRDPGFRPEAEQKIAAIGPMIAGQVGANAGAMFSREVQVLGAGGDARFSSIPDAGDIAATKPGDLKALMEPALAEPADVVIVGDVTVPAAIKAVQDTLAAGTARRDDLAQPPRAALVAPRAAPYVVTHNGRADQAFYGEMWSLPDFFAAPQTSYVADVAAAVLQARLIDTVREKLGLTYSPSARAVSSIELPGHGYFLVALETPPANFEAFRKALDVQLAALASKPVSDDELARAKQPLIDAHQKQLENNGYWERMLPLVLRNPQAATAITGAAAGLATVSAADVEQLFKSRITGHMPVTVISRAK